MNDFIITNLYDKGALSFLADKPEGYIFSLSYEGTEVTETCILLNDNQIAGFFIEDETFSYFTSSYTEDWTYSEGHGGYDKDDFTEGVVQALDCLLEEVA